MPVATTTAAALSYAHQQVKMKAFAITRQRLHIGSINSWKLPAAETTARNRGRARLVLAPHEQYWRQPDSDSGYICLQGQKKSKRSREI